MKITKTRARKPIFEGSMSSKGIRYDHGSKTSGFTFSGRNDAEEVWFTIDLTQDEAESFAKYVLKHLTEI